jgi:hypothetical protein
MDGPRVWIISDARLCCQHNNVILRTNMIDQSYSGQHSAISGPAQDGDGYAQRFKVIDNVAGSSRVLTVPENTRIDVAAPAGESSYRFSSGAIIGMKTAIF